MYRDIHVAMKILRREFHEFSRMGLKNSRAFAKFAANESLFSSRSSNRARFYFSSQP